MTQTGPSGTSKKSAGVIISHPDRVIFPKSGTTKGALADYYEAIASIMLPFTAQRPITLVRCPQGSVRKCFFQKHDTGGFGDAVKQIPIREKDGQIDDYLYIEDPSGLLQCVQMGTIEFHGWGSHCEDVEAPDRMVFDLDPGAGLGFDEVKTAAVEIRDRLLALGLESFAMLSGGKGMHVIVPLQRGHSWEEHRAFAKRFAETLSLAKPDRFIATISKAKRTNRIFIDWLRNQRGNTAVLPYSARAKSSAPVAAPVAWNELTKIADARAFSISDVELLVDRSRGKSLSGWGYSYQCLPDS